MLMPGWIDTHVHLTGESAVTGFRPGPLEQSWCAGVASIEHDCIVRRRGDLPINP